MNYATDTERDKYNKFITEWIPFVLRCYEVYLMVISRSHISSTYVFGNLYALICSNNVSEINA